MRRIPLRAIAEKADCTRSTVSYALRNHPGISGATRARIQAIARELGWVPDIALHQQMSMVRSTLNRTSLPNLGVILHQTRDGLAKLLTIRRHLDGVLQQARALGFAADVFNLCDQPLSPKRLAAIMRTRGIRGMVMVDLDLSIPREYWALAEHFAAVSIGVDPEHTPVHVAIADYLSIGRRAVREFLRLGYRRPGLILPRVIEKLLNWSFTGGFHAGIAVLPPEDRLPVHYFAEDRFYLLPSEFPDVVAWLDRNRPDVLLATDTVTLARCIGESPRHAHLPIYSLDWHPGENAVGGIDQRSDAIGRAGVSLLAGQIEQGQVGRPELKLKVLVQEDWVPAPSRRTSGRSLPRPKAK